MKMNNIQYANVATVGTIMEYYNGSETFEKIIPQTNELALEIYHEESKIYKYIHLVLKRSIDIIGAIIGIGLLIPIMAIVWVANIISGDFGPLFYSHKRIGKDGKYFNMYKFRSMCTDSEERLKKLLEENEEARKEWEENQKLTNDPRITKIGNFLRKTSIDEVPQFINVLKGEMSLVRTSRCSRWGN